MKHFSRDLKNHPTEIINHKKMKIIPLTNDENEFYLKQKVCHICRKEFSINDDDKNYHKVRDYCHYTGKYRVAAYNFSHFIIKELAEKFEGSLNA